METIIGIKSSKDMQKNCVLGQKLEKKGYKVIYELKTLQKNRNLNLLVLIVDETFSFFEACNYLLEKNDYKGTMIWVLTEQEVSEQEKSMFYKLGACICLKRTKENDEALHSITNVLRILNGEKKQYTLDKSKRSLIVNNSEKELTPKEYILFEFLNEHIDEVVSYETCCQILWKKNITDGTTRVANIVHSLRTKLVHNQELSIKTIRGKGYILIKGSNSIIQKNN